MGIYMGGVYTRRYTSVQGFWLFLMGCKELNPPYNFPQKYGDTMTDISAIGPKKLTEDIPIFIAIITKYVGLTLLQNQ